MLPLVLSTSSTLVVPPALSVMLFYCLTLALSTVLFCILGYPRKAFYWRCLQCCLIVSLVLSTMLFCTLLVMFVMLFYAALPVLSTMLFCDVPQVLFKMLFCIIILGLSTMLYYIFY